MLIAQSLLILTEYRTYLRRQDEYRQLSRRRPVTYRFRSNIEFRSPRYATPSHLGKPHNQPAGRPAAIDRAGQVTATPVAGQIWPLPLVRPPHDTQDNGEISGHQGCMYHRCPSQPGQAAPAALNRGAFISIRRCIQGDWEGDSKPDRAVQVSDQIALA